MLPQRRSVHSFGQLCNPKQGPDQTVTSFVAYINGLALEINVLDAIKRMSLQTELCPEVRSIMLRGITYQTLDTMVDAAIWAENDLQFEAKYLQTWSNRVKAADKSSTKHEQQQQQ